MVDGTSDGSFHVLQQEVLAVIAANAPLRAIGERLCRGIEALLPGVTCSILGVDADGRLHPLAAPGLPAAYSRSLEGLAAGPAAGSCGTAVWRGEAVLALDIAGDPLWDGFRSHGLPPEFRACWSSPIRAGDGRVIGTFAFYYRSARGPTAQEREIVGQCVPMCAIAISHDEARSRLERLTHYDGLTGLPNLARFRQRAREAVERLPPGHVAALVHLDLDGFGRVDHALEHHGGDRVLAAVAARLAASAEDGTHVARIGDDKFALLRSGAGDVDVDAAAVLGQTALAAFSEPFEVDGREVPLSASVGAAGLDASSIGFAELSRRADVALAAAQRDGGRICRVFAAAMEVRASPRHDLERDLRAAVAAGAFALAFQPIFELATGRLVAAEALLRWPDPRHSGMSPAEFVPVVEAMDLIGTLGAWVLREACAQASRWPLPLRIGVNLSPLQLRRADFVLDVVGALQDTGLPAERLELEVTESAVLAHDVATRVALNMLHDYGVRLALDDFGTGYSSLQVLRAFPFDRIKIDMSFVRDIEIDADSSAIIRAMLQLARDLGMHTTAEGIESESQRGWLERHGCDEGQGYWFGRPAAGADFHAMLRGRASHSAAAAGGG